MDSPAPERADSSPLPLAGEGGAQRRVRAEGRKSDSTSKARRLRLESTEPERLLWGHLRNRHLGGYRFVRQYPIGPYFADFVCREAMLVVELDGGQHSDSAHDLVRDRWINEAGYSILRFWNNDVTRNLGGVLETLQLTLEGRPSPGLRYAPATLSRDAGEGKMNSTTLLPSPDWRFAPATLSPGGRGVDAAPPQKEQ